MTTAATPHAYSHTTAVTLFVAFALSKHWKLGFTTGHGQKPRERTVSARQQERVLDEIAQPNAAWVSLTRHPSSLR